MTFNSLILFLATIIFLMSGFLLILIKSKKKKRSADSIYKLIDDLEKKYIY